MDSEQKQKLREVHGGYLRYLGLAAQRLGLATDGLDAWFADVTINRFLEATAHMSPEDAERVSLGDFADLILRSGGFVECTELRTHFECTECGRWTGIIEAAVARDHAAGSVAGIDLVGFDLLRERSRTEAIGPALLQREFKLSYDEAVVALETANRLGLLEGSGKRYVAGAARCDVCYERRLASAKAPVRSEAPHRRASRESDSSHSAGSCRARPSRG